MLDVPGALPKELAEPDALPKDDDGFEELPNDAAGLDIDEDPPPAEVLCDPPEEAPPPVGLPNIPPDGMFWEAFKPIPFAKDGEEPPVPGPEFAALGSYLAPVFITLFGL